MAKISKKVLASVVKKSATLEDAAAALGINRRQLYTLRKEAGMPVGSRR